MANNLRPTAPWIERLYRLFSKDTDRDAIKVFAVDQATVIDQTTGEVRKLSVQSEMATQAVEALNLLVAEQRKTNFLLERLTEVEIDAEAFSEN